MNEQGSQQADVVIVGAGAAGLATAIHAGEILPGRRIVILEGARQVGAKILVSGGGRCNVTNRVVTADDYRGSSRAAIGRVLARFNVENTFDWFKAMGVELYEEELGKLFPDSNSARTIVEELVRTARHRGVNICTGQRVLQIDKQEHSFVIRTATGEWIAPQVVLACGGQSLPRSGSDGWGYRVVQHFGHSIVPPVPALVPFMLDGEIHATLRGISQPAEGRVWVEESPV
ncbi:MAG: hypothetical protein HJJLKODD_00187 [Phycisphaerae bacterium]|nr:hypothetical protein [Phycisphaerae bacterium]